MVKYKLIDLDNIKTEIEAFERMSFNTYTDIETYLKTTYTDNYKEIQKTIQIFSLSDSLSYLNLDIEELIK